VQAAVVCLLIVSIFSVPLRAQTPSVQAPEQAPLSTPALTSAAGSERLGVTVTDENGVAVGSARVQLQALPAALPARCVTDIAGYCELSKLAPGSYELRVEKSGFYALSQPSVQVGTIASVDATLSHLQGAIASTRPPPSSTTLGAASPVASAAWGKRRSDPRNRAAAT
jgi:hypothetical protein